MTASKSTPDKIIIPITDPHYRGLVIIIDSEDESRVRAREWHVVRQKHHLYVRSGDLLLHRFILNAPDGVDIDHENGNGLDCRKSNMRYATKAQNARNARKRLKPATSRYKGVHRVKSNRKHPWRAIICVNRKPISLGYFAYEWDAALAYDEAARKYFGEFALLNFPRTRF